MKEYIYILKLTERLTKGGAWKKEDEEIVSEHFEYLLSLKDKNSLILAGRTQVEDLKTMGIVIIKADDDLSAENIMLNDPAVKKGIMTCEFAPFQTAVMQ